MGLTISLSDTYFTKEINWKKNQSKAQNMNTKAAPSTRLLDPVSRVSEEHGGVPVGGARPGARSPQGRGEGRDVKGFGN